MATGRASEVFKAFLKLGLTSFGGPIAHLGYFRDEFVTRRRWLDETAFADLVALCQFLPGPASSQVGFSLGLLRGGGLLGGLAAWTAFTLPSAFLLLALALGVEALTGAFWQGLIHGLKLVAVAVVAQAVWGMARTLAPDRLRATIALVALALTALAAGSGGQILAIVVGSGLGLVFCRGEVAATVEAFPIPVSPRAGILAFALAAAFFVLPYAATAMVPWQGFDLFEAFYRSGALVFGGGHVVLPLLRAEVVDPGWIGADRFLAGYGAAQAVPGPLFTFAAFLGGAVTSAPNGVLGATIALVAIFLPGLLLVYGALPFWSVIRAHPLAFAAMRGANAAVTGILAAALYDPVWTSAVAGPRDFAIAAAAFILLTVWKLPPWLVVLLTALAGLAS